MSARDPTPRGGSAAGVTILILVLLACVALGWCVHVARSRQAARGARVQEEAERHAREAQVREAEGKLEQARRLLFEATEARLFPSREEWSQAESLYKQACELDPGARAAVAGQTLIQGVWRAMEGEDEQVEALLRSVDSREEEILARYVLGWLLLRLEKPLESWGLFQMVLRERPRWLPARLGRAWADVESGDFEEACQVLEEALVAWPARAELVVAYARCLGLRSGPEASLGWYVQAFEMGARSSDTVEGYVTSKLADGQAETVLRALADLVPREPDRADLHFQHGRVLEALERFPEAAAAYRVALDLEPESVEILNALGAQYLYDGESERAAQLFEASWKLEPRNADTHVYLAFAHEQLGKPPQTSHSLGQACRFGSRFGCREACLDGQEEACRRLPPDVQREVSAELQERSRRESASRTSSSSRRRSSYTAYRTSTSSYRRPSEKGRIYVVGDRRQQEYRSSGSSPRRSSSAIPVPWTR